MSAFRYADLEVNMDNREWYQVDNVANVFLATVNKRDTRSLRISCTLKEKIIPEILQEALDEAIILRPQFHVRIHRGFFWHYIEESQTTPLVTEESRRVCPLLYNAGNRRKLHFNVSYFNNRINFDMFHALGDGTGALEFLNLLTLTYLKKLHPDELRTSVINTGASADELSQDSFNQFYESKSESPVINKKAYKPRSLKFPFDQLQFIEVHMPLLDVIKRSKELNVGLTSYLAANLTLAFEQDMPKRAIKMPISINVPVNLRNYYPSDSIRNFFNNISLTHTAAQGDSLKSVAAELDATLKENLTPEMVKAHMNYYLGLQKNVAARAVPLFMKSPGLKFFTKLDDKHTSAVLSNLGAIKLPDEVAKYVDYYSAYCSSENIFVTMCSYKDRLVLGITNPFVNTGIIKDFIRRFSNDGIPVRIYSTEVIS